MVAPLARNSFDMLALLALLSHVEHIVTLAYQKGWNKATAHGRFHGYPARPRHQGILISNQTGADDFTAGWNAAVFYCLKFGHSPPMLRHNIMHKELAAQRDMAITEMAKSEDLAVMYT